MISLAALKAFMTVVYVWFAAGAGVIGIFAAKELWFLVTGKKVDGEKSSEVKLS